MLEFQNMVTYGQIPAPLYWNGWAHIFKRCDIQLPNVALDNVSWFKEHSFDSFVEMGPHD